MKNFQIAISLFAFIFVEVRSASVSNPWFTEPVAGSRNTRRLPQPQIIFGEIISTSTNFPRFPITTTPPPVSTVATTTVPACKPDGSILPASSLTDDKLRSKLCPNATQREYRFDVDAKVCSLPGKQSHCGKNMIFYSFAGNKIYGHCDCDYSSKIPLLYHATTKRCYFMYQQGYCKADEWLEMNKQDGKILCSRNTCHNVGRDKFGALPLAARDMSPEYVPLRGNGPCVRLNQPNMQFCKKRGDIVTFRWPLEFYPNCGAPISSPLPAEVPSLKFLGDIPALECAPGSYLSSIGDCQQEWEFD